MPPLPKTVSPADAAKQVRPRDFVAVPLGPGQPTSFLNALGERDDFEDLQVFTAILTAPFRLFTRRGVRLLSGFYGPLERALLKQGHDVQFVPADFRSFARLARRFAPRVMATLAAPPDADGWLSLSLHAGATVDELHRAGSDPDRLLVVETSSHLPRTVGLPPEHPHRLHLSEVDVLVEGEAAPVVLPELPPSDVERAIARHAAAYIPDGATLQTGIGGIPNAVAEILAEGPGGDYGIHTEMFTTGLMRLHQAGKVTNRKGVFDGFSVATFAMGTQELYAWLDGNQAVRFLPVTVMNDPTVIARNRNMVSMNGALTIDLAGQVAADTLDGQQYSGIGGHEDFVVGATHAAGGHSLICLPSTARVGGRLVSRVVGALPEGSIVTTPRHQVDVVVTEWGAAELVGHTVAERAQALADVAHPDFRDALREQAARLLPARTA